jgi:hypothetical protein
LAGQPWIGNALLIAADRETAMGNGAKFDVVTRMEFAETVIALSLAGGYSARRTGH